LFSGNRANTFIPAAQNCEEITQNCAAGITPLMVAVAGDDATAY
jgi:hypothetical protein